MFYVLLQALGRRLTPRTSVVWPEGVQMPRNAVQTDENNRLTCRQAQYMIVQTNEFNFETLPFYVNKNFD